MPAPSSYPRWADNPSDPGDVVEPSSGVKDDGWNPATRPPAQWFNWLFLTIYLWIKWFNEELLESGSRVLRLGAMVGDGGDSTGSGPAFKYEVFSSGGTQGFNLVSNVNFAARHLNISDIIPDGADLVGVRAMVKPGAARGTGDAMLISVRTMAINWTTPAAPSWTVLAFSLDEDDGTTNVQKIGGGVLSVTNDRATQQILARVQCGNDAGTNEDIIYGWEISYTGAKVR